MTKLIFKYDSIRKDVIPNIYDIIDELNDIKFKIEKLDIPQDFKYYNYIKSLETKIDDYKKIYNSLIDNIDILNKNLEIEFSNIDLSIIKDI